VVIVKRKEHPPNFFMAGKRKMKLSDLPKTTQDTKKRIGRGHGSGRGGHTSTRGNKGQKSRGKIGLFFEGTKIKKSLLKRLPLFRGKGKFKPLRTSPFVVNLKYLNIFKAQEEITLNSLKEKRILAKDFPDDAQVKILGEGEINIPLIVLIPTSKGARQKIEKAGGRVEAGGENTETDKVEKTKKKSVRKSKLVKKEKSVEGDSFSANALATADKSEDK